MNLMTIENISKSYSVKLLFDQISFGIEEGEKIGLIGVNGTGKSTLLKILAGLETPDTGKITKGNAVRVEYLSQDPSFDPESTVLEQVFKGNSQEMVILRQYQAILEQLQTNYDETLNERLLRLQDDIERLGLWDLESEAKSILTKLGINQFFKKMGLLSGGQRKRVALACALITPSDLLILDEPTNHLDNDTINILEDYLNGRKGALLMITHDRYFLDRVTNRIIELDHGRLFSYDGNYSLFLEKKMERLEIESSMEQKRQNLLRKELAWVRRGAQARSTKQKARLQRYDDLKNESHVKQNGSVEISVASTRLGRKIIEFHNISKSFEGRPIISNLEYMMTREDRVGIVGPNGIGKSTLINLIRGKYEIDSGVLEIGETVNIGCFSQEVEEMNPTMRAIDYIKEKNNIITTADGTQITASQMCERFLFSPHLQYSQIGTLSGGERRRLYLLRILMDAPNVLLLDEPTNDLDIDTLRRLEDYLDDFKGVLLTVSHDRYFLDRVCNKIFAYEGAGNIHIYTGNYSEYLNFKEAQELEELTNSPKVSTTKEKPRLEKKLKFTYAEQKEYETIDSDIEMLENQVVELDEALVLNATDYVKLQDIMTQKETVEETLSTKYERWEYLNQLAEAIEEQKRK